MAVSKLLIKNFSGFRGLDLTSSDLTRLPEYSSSMKNAMYTRTRAIIKRKGYQYKTDNYGGIGFGVYNNIDTSTGTNTETIVTVNDSLYKVVSDSFNITYSGSNIALLNIELDPDTNKFSLIITEDEVELVNIDLGIGLDESLATSVSSVISTIDALADFAASGGTDTTGSAAFLDLHFDTQLTATATAVNYLTYSQVNEAKANPLATTLAAINNTDFENVSLVNLSNCLYVTSGYDYMHKYDGQTFYRAGMPAGGDSTGTPGNVGTKPTTADTGSGATFTAGDDYFYKYSYIQYDNKGNVIEGDLSPGSTKHTVAAANTNITVTLKNITAASGFNTNCAIVNGNQSGVTTITVDSGNTLKVGDTAYFYDGNTSAYVTKTLTAVTDTSITFAGSVNVSDNAVISNNLRIALYRTVQIGAETDPDAQIYYLVKEIPNDSTNATQAYVDAISDANLGSTYIQPIKNHGLPPKCRYATAFANQLILAGIPDNVNKVRYSDVDNPEYFADGTSDFLVDAHPGSKIKGIAALDTSIIVFKDKSIQSIQGDLNEDNFRVNEISFGGIGCVAHHSIKEINRSLFFLSTNGVYSVNMEGVVPIGDRIQSEFTAFDVGFNFQKAIAVNWINSNKYVLFMPNESLNGSDYYADDDSKCYVYDYSQDSWFKWDNINAQGGFAYKNNRLYFTARRLDSISGNIEYPMAIFNNYGDKRDYSDHQVAVDFEYSTSWHSLGEPNVYKKFTRLKTFALSNDILDGSASLNTLTVNTEFNFATPAVFSSFTQDFSSASTGWGSAWGNSPYGDSPLIEISSKLKVLKSRSIRFTFANSTALEDVLISGYELEVAPPYIRAIKQ